MEKSGFSRDLVTSTDSHCPTKSGQEFEIVDPLQKQRKEKTVLKQVISKNWRWWLEERCVRDDW